MISTWRGSCWARRSKSSATAAVLVDPAIGVAGDFDSVQVLLKTASGKQAMISNSRRATYGYDQRIEVHGSKGAVSAENQRPVSIEVATGAGYTRPPLHDFFMTRYTEAYAAEIATFIAAMAGQGQGGADGRGWADRAGAGRCGGEVGGRGARGEDFGSDPLSFRVRMGEACAG
jgi:predicted dehydrogenase